jgi:predicted kinase
VTVLLYVSGIPGTGKSSVARALGQELSMPILAKDELEAALRRAGFTSEDRTGWTAYELMSVLADALLQRDVSVILDSVATTARIRSAWEDIAHRYGARFLGIECICSDKALHRSRMAVRRRGIPGWPELTWDEVESVRERYEPLSEPLIRLDAVNDLDQNVALALEKLAHSAL